MGLNTHSTGDLVPSIVDTEYYPFVDGLRGLAVLAVMGVHTSQTAGSSFTNPMLTRLAESGARGVQLFFIVSAFTLLSTSLQRFPTERFPRRDFYLRRAFRILPLWWSAIALYAVVAQKGGLRFGGVPADATNIFLDGTFLFGFTPSHVNSFVPGGWTLFCEETFYLLLPFLYDRVRDLQRAAGLTVALLAVSLLWFGAAHLAFPPDREHLAFSYFFPLGQWFVFGYGMLLFYVLKRTGRRALSGNLCLAVDALAAILLWTTLSGRPIGPQHYGAATALLLIAFCASQERSLWNRLIDNRLMRLFGKCCYSIYLLHFLVIGIAERLQSRFYAVFRLANLSPDLRVLAWFMLIAASCLVVGTCSFYLFERPAVRLGRRLIERLERGQQLAGDSESRALTR